MCLGSERSILIREKSFAKRRAARYISAVETALSPILFSILWEH
jgi:hypothetical protein